MKVSARSRIRVICLVLALSLLAPTFIVSAQTDKGAGVALPGTPISEAVGITPEELDSMAIDPQSWRLTRDMTFDDLNPNPVIDWAEELNPEGLRNPKGGGSREPLKGGLVLIDYLDRKFISGQERGSDPLGYYLFNADGTYQDEITRNPVISVLDDPEQYPGGYSDLPLFWANYVNTPQEINNGLTADKFWRENSYGKWAVELEGYGVYTIPYFEFEVMSDGYETFRDVPPSFRQGNATQSSPTRGGSGIASNDAATHGREVARRGGATGAGNPWGLSANMPGVSTASPAPFANFDFFFLLHAGYCESGTWMEFGMLQYATRQDIPYELGPGPRLEKVEKFFTDYPQWIPIYAARYASGWANNTSAWATGNYNTGNAAVVEKINNVYRPTRFWVETLDKYNVAFNPNYATYDATGEAARNWKFQLPQEDWDWVNGYFGATDYVGRSHTNNTRYVPFTSWEGLVGEWSYMSSASGGTGYGQTGAGRSLQYSMQGENVGLATYAHEFGHIAGLPDNYGNPWTLTTSALVENWELMARGSFAGPFGDHARWTVPAIEAETAPVHNTMRMKQVAGFYDTGDILRVNIRDLAAGTPIVANIVPRNVPLNNNGYYPWLEEDYGLVSPNYYKGIRLGFDLGANDAYRDLATRKTTGFTWNANTGDAGSNRSYAMGIEVTQRTGFDSYLNDDGVLISRIGGDASASGGNRIQIVNSHLYDLDMVDFILNGVVWKYPLASPANQAAAAFRAGKSFTDTGYYESVVDLNTGTFIKPGSEWQWEEQDGREIVAGDTINEWYDPFNRMHYYILRKFVNEGKYGDFLSYEVAVRHDNGKPVGGSLVLEPVGEPVPASKGNYAVQTYSITNTGDATDIVRIGLDGVLAEGRTREVVAKWDGQVRNPFTRVLLWPNAAKTITRTIPTAFSEQNAAILNDLYAVGAGETVTFNVYIKEETNCNQEFDTSGLLIVTASSETNDAKAASIAGPVLPKGPMAKVIPTASVDKLNGNKNNLWITVTEVYADGTEIEFTQMHSINNNAEGTYKVGPYNVFVDTKGNTQIRSIYIVW